MSEVLSFSYEIRVVLVGSLYERNVGAISRAMSNMGVEKLILVDPKCKFTYESQQAAATGQAALQSRTVYSSWQDFETQEPASLRLALTARDGRGRKAEDLAETLTHLRATSPLVRKPNPPVLHLIFGPEDCGLAAEDLMHAHWACLLPTYGSNTSLNLAQACLLALFLVRNTWGGELTTRQRPPSPDSQPLSPQGIFPDELFRQWLEQLGFRFATKKINAFTTLKRMMLQNTPTAKEFRVLEIVLRQTIRKLRDKK